MNLDEIGCKVLSSSVWCRREYNFFPLKRTTSQKWWEKSVKKKKEENFNHFLREWTFEGGKILIQFLRIKKAKLIFSYEIIKEIFKKICFWCYPYEHNQKKRQNE